MTAERSRRAVAVVIGALGVTLAARVSAPLPGTDVPQSAQTLAVGLVAAWLGPVDGVVALLLYLALGAVGLPVFADGASGVQRLVGPTAGYLAGFIVGAWILGRALEGRRRAEAGRSFAGFLALHAVVLGLGWGRLTLVSGPGPAWAEGVRPFLLGSLVKSGIGAGVVVFLAHLGARDDARAEP